MSSVLAKLLYLIRRNKQTSSLMIFQVLKAWWILKAAPSLPFFFFFFFCATAEIDSGSSKGIQLNSLLSLLFHV